MRKATLLFFTVLSMLYINQTHASTISTGVQPTVKDAAKTQVLVSKMRKAFGGSGNLKRIRFITYTLTRASYQDGDTIRTKQLWYIDMRSPRVVRLDISGTDTVVSSQTHESLLRARFFNFLYMLSSPDVTFQFLRTSVYQEQPISIVRATENMSKATLDLFVAADGRIVTTSTVNNTTGKYESFADEGDYKRQNRIIFPMSYVVLRQGKVSAEGLFSELCINSLAPFWKKHLAVRNAR